MSRGHNFLLTAPILADAAVAGLGFQRRREYLTLQVAAAQKTSPSLTSPL
jgi:hypothetical protein